MNSLLRNSPVALARNSVRRASLAATIARIRRIETELADVDEDALRKQALALKFRARSGESLRILLPAAYALVCESAWRAHGMRPYDVQLQGAIAVHDGSIAEMQTGEGKTLTATMPMFLASLAGKGAHLATANDYLAQRDADWTMPIYAQLGAKTGVIQSEMAPAQRRASYACDITYGTAKEFGFDFLRDRLARHTDGHGSDCTFGRMFRDGSDATTSTTQRQLYFALVDEADSILIDEARTPLIVSALPDDSVSSAQKLFEWSVEVVEDFCIDVDFHVDPKSKYPHLTTDGRHKARTLRKPRELSKVSMLELYEQVELAIKVNRDYQRDRHYVVRDKEIVIVDEFTGRLAEGRRWRDGVHQTIEAREGVDISVATDDAARVTIQDFFQMYSHLAGMTGTAANSRRELQSIYHTRVEVIPTHRPSKRSELPTRVFGTNKEKWKAISEEVKEMHAVGRPVLVGTRSIDRSELLSQLLTDASIEHDVLNARHIAREAEIVAKAGKSGRVTVATNMAGRGTDIELDQAAKDAGGLHVICTELHESQRVDRQLIGRCGRQGDPGSFRQFLALDDEILRTGLGKRTALRLARIGSHASGDLARFARLFRRAQSRAERKQFRQRRLLMYHERERRELQLQMGQDPYLESPS